MWYINPYIQQVSDHSRIFDGVDSVSSQRWCWSDFFRNTHPITLEIGTGMGNFFSRYADANREENLIGMEIKYKRLIRTMQKCEALDRSDVVLLKEYGEKISEIFAPGEVGKVFLFFPDPWPRKKHWKHRILQESFLDDLYSVLANDGIFEFKTDHEDYFAWWKDLFENHPGFEIISTSMNFEGDKKFAHTNSTEFEMIWRTQGKKVMLLRVQKSSKKED